MIGPGCVFESGLAGIKRQITRKGAKITKLDLSSCDLCAFASNLQALPESHWRVDPSAQPQRVGCLADAAHDGAVDVGVTAVFKLNIESMTGKRRMPDLED